MDKAELSGIELTIIEDSRRTNPSPQMKLTLPHSNNSAHKSSLSKTSGDITTIPPWTRSRCASQSIYSNKVSNQSGKTEEI